MTEWHPTATTTGAGDEELSSPSTADLSAAIGTLTQAAQALTTTAGQMMQMMQTLTKGTNFGWPPLGEGSKISETDKFNALLERFRRAEGGTLLLIEPNSERLLTAEELSLGLQFLSEVLTRAEALARTLEQLERNPQADPGLVFSDQLRELKRPLIAGGLFVPLDAIEVLGMGIGSPGYVETRKKGGAEEKDEIRESGSSKAFYALVAALPLIMNPAVDAYRIHETTRLCSQALGDPKVPTSVKQQVCDLALNQVPKTPSATELKKRGVSASVLPSDKQTKRHTHPYGPN